MNARSAEIKRDGSLKPDLSRAPDPICWSQRPRPFRHQHDALSAEKTLRRDHLTGGVTPPSAIAVTDLDSGVVASLPGCDKGVACEAGASVGGGALPCCALCWTSLPIVPVIASEVGVLTGSKSTRDESEAVSLGSTDIGRSSVGCRRPNRTRVERNGAAVVAVPRRSDRSGARKYQHLRCVGQSNR